MNFPCHPAGAVTYDNAAEAAAAAPNHPLARPRATSLTGTYQCVQRTEGLFIRVDIPGVQNMSYNSFQQRPAPNVVSFCTNNNIFHFRACSTDRDYEWFIRLSRNLRDDEICFDIKDGVFRMSFLDATGSLHFLNISTPEPQDGLVRCALVGARLHDCKPYVAYQPRENENTDMADFALEEVYPQRIRGAGGVCAVEQIRSRTGGMLKITFDAPGVNAADRYQLHINRTSANMGWVEIKCSEGVVPRRVYSVAFATTCGCCYLDRPNMEVMNGW